MNIMEKIIAIVPAAGAGKRLGLGFNKAFAPLLGVPLLAHTLHMLARTQLVQEAIVVLAAGEVAPGAEMLARYREKYFPALALRIVAGGAERSGSVANALRAVPPDAAYIAVHDGARPFADRAVFERTLAAARECGAAIAAVPVKNTIKVVDALEKVLATPPRSSLVAVQTPQIFRAQLLREAYAFLAAHPAAVTDDASVAELCGHEVAVALGSYENIKITTPEDLVLAEHFLRARREEESMEEIKHREDLENRKDSESGKIFPSFRAGCGYDVHRLVSGRKLILCGVTIPCELGLLGHSDADVALHALMDALLGAAALGDIGKFFPDTDEKFRDADSAELARAVAGMLRARGWQINNVDVTIIAQRPKLAPFMAEMRANVAGILEIAEDAVNVKATTTEKLGFTGRGEGIASEAVATLIKI